MEKPNIAEDHAAARITIVLEKNGRIMINGPLHDKILCFGLLEMAKNIIHEETKQKEESRIARPNLVMSQPH